MNSSLFRNLVSFLAMNVGEWDKMLLQWGRIVSLKERILFSSLHLGWKRTKAAGYAWYQELLP